MNKDGKTYLRLLMLLIALSCGLTPVFAKDNRLAAVNAQLDAYDSKPPVYNQYPSYTDAREQIAPPVYVIKPSVNVKAHHFDLGHETYYYRYVEPTIDVYLRGVMKGYQTKYSYRPPEGSLLANKVIDVFSFEGRYTRGDLDYKSASGIDNNITNKMYELKFTVGKDYYTGQMKFTPYFGFGYRYLIDRAGGRLTTNNSSYGYNRESHYYFLPMGVNVQLSDNGVWETSANIEYDYFLQGTQKSRLSDGDQFNGLGNDDLRNHQKQGYGLRGSMRFLRKFPNINVYAEPFMRYWSIDQSKVQSARVDGSVGNFVEPKNYTVELGSKFGLQF